MSLSSNSLKSRGKLDVDENKNAFKAQRRNQCHLPFKVFSWLKSWEDCSSLNTQRSRCVYLKTMCSVNLQGHFLNYHGNPTQGRLHSILTVKSGCGNLTFRCYRENAPSVFVMTDKQMTSDTKISPYQIKCHFLPKYAEARTPHVYTLTPMIR